MTSTVMCPIQVSETGGCGGNPHADGEFRAQQLPESLYETCRGCQGYTPQKVCLVIVFSCSLY